MAESLRYKVEEHLTCSVCLEPFKDPKVLPCLHSYCHVCIVNLAKNANSNTINCPECRLVVEVNENTVSTLPSNFFVNNLLATMTLTNDEPAAKKIVCDSCDSEDAAQSRCNECAVFLCQFCTEFHKRSRLMKHHELMTMEQLKSNPGPQNIAEKIRCPKHKQKAIKLFCKTCQTTICRDCIIVDHRQHEYGFVEEVAVEEKRHLQSNLNEVKQRKGRVAQGIVNLKKFNEGLEAKKNSTISEISQHFDQIVKAVESRRREMMERATSITNFKQKQIHAQLEVLEVALASCESSIEFTEQAFKNGNDVQILSMEKYILQSLEQLKAVKDQTKPCVTEDMRFIIPSSVQEKKKELLIDYDVDVTVANPESCTTSFKETKATFNPGKQYSITLICHDKNNRRLRYGGQDIKPSFTGMEVSDVAVTDNKDGSYTISFCPRQGGMLKFEVSIDGTPAPNCSLTKQVKWVINDARGKGPITDGGRTMTGDGAYCCRVGGCYFDSGVHTWKVRLSNVSWGQQLISEVGIIDYDEINADIAQSKKKCVHKHSVPFTLGDDISFTLDMEKRTLNVKVNSSRRGYNTTNSYQFTARRVSPFFACSSPLLFINLVE
ncbi:tripartite motif-containing 45-like [Paramuricea clavata]|uniref:Tripartite motif-containing 45-like n=1 Tax=Paramuricea clavata TaxID=317549 RepID=A0A6S7HWN2_PARCT|nr:tripartite motif-containing 45-like [Paramuricea clavata]